MSETLNNDGTNTVENVVKTDKTIGELPAAETLTDNSLIPIEQNGQAKSLSGQQLREFAAAAGSEGSAVLYTAQTLTAAQQEQARMNIGAVSVEDVQEAISEALGDYEAAVAALDVVIGGGVV